MKKMNLEEIQELIKFVAKSGATEVDLEMEGVKISIKSPPKKRRGEKDDTTTIIQHAAPQTIPSQVITSQIPLVKSENLESDNANENSQNENPKIEKDENKYITIKSSMIGTFYRSPSPEKPSFVNIGDNIKKGDTICIIEAMKLFNEIESEIEGKVIKVLVDDANPVEFEQDLFLIDPS